MAEFTLVDSGLEFDGGKLRYAWFRLREPDGREVYRVVTWKELAYLPIEARQDPDVLGKQWAALRGLYNGRVDFVYTVLGAFRPVRLGVAQFYGAAAESPVLTAAAEEALARLAAVEAVLANFPHSRLRTPDVERVQLLIERLRSLKRLLALLGHPDPRLSRKGLGRDGSLGEADDELASQQGEMLLRGLAKLREDFVFLVTAAHVPRPQLTRNLVRVAERASQFASRRRGTISASFSIAIPLAATLASAYAANGSRARGESHSHARGISEGWGRGETHAWGHGVSHARTHGEAHTQSWSETDGVAVGRSHTETNGTAHTTSWAHMTGGAKTHSTADTTSHTKSMAHSTGSTWAKSVSDGTAHTTSHASGNTWSHAEANGTAHTTNQATSTSTGSGTSWGRGGGMTISSADTHGTSEVNSTAAGTTWGTTSGESHSVSVSDSQTTSAAQSTSLTTGTSQAHTASSGWSVGDTLGGKVEGSLGIPGVASIGLGANNSISGSYQHGNADTTGASQTVASGTTIGSSHAHTAGTTDTTSFGTSHGGSLTTGHAEGTTSAHTSGTASSTFWNTGGSSFSSTSTSQGTADTTSHMVTNSQGGFTSQGTADTTSHTVTNSHGGFSSTTRGEAWGTAHTEGTATTKSWANTVGGARTTSHATSDGWSVVRSHAVTRGEAHTVSDAETWGESWNEGRAVSRSHQVGRSESWGRAASDAVVYGGGRTFVGGLSAGIVPGVSIGRSWQTEDDVAERLTEVARQLESLLNTASLEGGFLTTALLLTTDAGAKAAASLAPQAFHGPNVPTPVLTVEGDDDLRLHALAARPSLQPDGDPFDAGLWTRWGTLLTPGQLAAYTAPNVFEEGTATTVQEKIPPLAFYPELEGDVVLGHQISPETGDETNVPLRIARERHFHTAFVADTGYGKSVAAERLVLESTVRWKMRTVVLDFGAGWRKLLNAPGLDGRVEIRQLSPGGVRPLRWNPLQIGRHVLPEVQWRAFCDIFGAVSRLGVRRQVHELREALRTVYLDAGVLVDDPECRHDPRWGAVQPGEAALVAAAAGTRLADLTPEQRQRLAVERSKAVGLADLYAAVEDKLRHVPPRDAMLRGVLEGILFRLHPLVQGAAASQYAAGPDTVDINEIVPGEWGVAVLEGGAFLDQFSKAFLLGWAAWHIYTDAVIQRIRRARTEPARIQIVFEEANKILTGVPDGDEEGGASPTAEQFESMWRDSRKYGIWLHIITQSPSQIPQGILSSCNNLVVGQVKNARDRDIVTAMIHRSEKGFVDEVWRRFLGSLPVGRVVVKLGYAFDRALVEPVYVHPIPVPAVEPTDEEIAERLGRIALH